MNVLSLFDGMSCGQQALERSEFEVNKYYASEIDKYAIQVTMANYPNTIQLGSVVNVDVNKLDKIDLLLGGSPCQSFSFAGKRKGMSTKCETEILTLEHYLKLKEQSFEFEGQSYLFWEYMRILTDIRKINPNVKFLLENVEMGEKWEKVLSKAIGVNGIHINSALVSAQNRKRIYWTNIGMQPGGLFGDMQSIITQPKDKGILLKDILENEVDDKYFLSEKALKYIQSAKFRQDANVLLPGEKSVCLQQARKEIVKIDKKGNVKKNQDKASCFTAGGNSGGNHSDMDLICVAMRGRNIDNPNDRRKGIELVQQLETRTDNKTNCLTSVQKDNLVIQLNPSKESGGKQPYQQNRVYDINGINPSLTTLWNGSNLINTSRIRRLTPTECERLQTVKDGYTSMVSDTQRYKMLGNGWTIDVICHILSYLKD
jgi:DNA-cytosine methyltransferase